jgi:hypothetical protein
MDKQELPINNPAERLYVILTRMAESSPESSIEDVLCTSMELETNDENFIEGSGQLFVLLGIIEEQIQYFSHQKQPSYLSLIKDIRKNLFNMIRLYNLHNSNKDKYLWQNVKDLRDPNWLTLQYLSGCVADFEERGISINKDSLNNLIDDIKSWMIEIEESQLDEDIKKFFIHKLMEIKHLLEKYYYYGSSQIKKEIYATMVEIGIYQENFPEGKKDKNRALVNTFLEKIFKLAGLLDPLISVVVNGSPMLSQGINIVKNLLPPGS